MARDAHAYLRERVARRLRIAVAVVGAGIAAVVLLVIALIAFDRPIDVLQTRYHFWKAGDWEVVKVIGYEEHPGFTVTGVVLAVAGRPDATVEIAWNSSWSPAAGIHVVNIKGISINELQPRLLAHPLLSDAQRGELREHYHTVDLKDTGPFANLFPHPIRDLKDLRNHYDEVYEFFREVADGHRPGVKK